MKNKLRLAVLISSLQLFPIFLGKTLFYGDNYSLLVPGKIFTANWIKQGIIPLWNPTILGGISWIGDISQSILYPSTALFILLPPASALNITIFLHLILTWVAMRLLSRSIGLSELGSGLAATIWTLSPQVTGSINNLATLQSVVWFPAVAYASYRLSSSFRSKTRLALIITLQLLAGYPQHVLYAIAVGFILHLTNIRPSLKSIKSTSRIWLISGVLTALLSAWITLPFINTFIQSTRSVQTATQATRGSLEFSMLAKIFVPYIWDHPTAGYKWGPAWSQQPNVALYATWIGLLSLVVLARHTKIPVWFKISSITCIVLIALALGNKLPLYSQLASAIPILKGGRYPSMALTPTMMLLSLNIGYAISQLKSKYITHKLVSIAASLVLVSTIGLIWWKIDASSIWQHTLKPILEANPFHTFPKDDIIITGILTNVVVNASLLLIALMSIKHKKVALLILCIAVDMSFNTRGLLFFGNRSLYDEEHIETKQIINVVGSDRILTRNFNTPYTDYGAHWEALTTREPFSDSYVDAQELSDQEWLQNLRRGLTPDWNMPVNIHTINGYTTLLPKDTADMWSNSSEARINFLDRIDPQSTLLDTWAVKYYVTDSRYFIPEDINLPTSLAIKEFTIYERPNALPKIRPLNSDTATISDTSETPNSLTFKVDTNQPTDIIVAQRYDSDWIGYIDGNKQAVTNHEGMQLITVPQGKVTVTLKYQPKLFIIGIIISITSLAGLIVNNKGQKDIV